MPSRSVRSAAALALATSATTFAYVGSAAPAQAAGYNGYCKTSSGVTVVVDFRGLGGGVTIRCSPVGSGASGADALSAAGIPVVQPRRTPGFVCRLYGKPSASATLPGGYHEQCVNTPPGTAHWHYFQASNGGSWGSSSDGFANSHVIPGGFEGWSFTEGSTNVAPGAAPSRPADAPKPPPATHTKQPPAPPRHTTTGAPKGTKTTAPKGGSVPGNGGDGGSNGSQPKSTTASQAAKTSTAKKKAAEKKASSSAAHASKSSKAKHSKGSSSSSAGGVSGTSSGAPTNAAGAPVANSDDLIKDSKKSASSSINATTVVGGGVLAVLAMGGSAVAIIRRRNLG